MRAILYIFSTLAASTVAMSASADIDPASGIDFATITHPGNAPWDGDGQPWFPSGRGRVDYEFSIGKYEVTSAQWLEFFNAAFARPDPLPFDQLWFRRPLYWGGETDPTYAGPGQRFRLREVPNAAMLPASNISWRTAAVFCNWLENGKSSSREAFISGAYDTSTFVFQNGDYQDQLTRSPGARYFIPSIDEWMKAVYYDPNKVNPDNTVGGWWHQPNGTDTPLIYGAPPGYLGGNSLSQANGSVGLWFEEPWHSIPLGAYPNVVSPWGLLDAAGGESEWTEEVDPYALVQRRCQKGSRRAAGGSYESDAVGGFGVLEPDTWLYGGLRIASTIPAPSSAVPLLACAVIGLRRRRR